MSIEDKIHQIDFEISQLKIAINSTNYRILTKKNILKIIEQRKILKKRKDVLLKNLERKNKLDNLGKQIR